MKAKSKKTGAKKFRIEISGASIFFWGLALFCLMGWIFVLGILVGRGFLSEKLEKISELKNSIARLQEITGEKRDPKREGQNYPEEEPKFHFFKELVDEKKETAQSGSEATVGVKKSGQGKDQSLLKNKNERDDSLPEKPESSRSPSKPDDQNEDGRTFSVQIASFTSSVQANDLANRYVTLGYPAFVNEVRIRGKIFYRVNCGRFKRREEAISLKDELASRKNVEGIIAVNARPEIRIPAGTIQKAESKAENSGSLKKEGTFTVQIASLNSEKDAVKMVKHFSSLGYSAYFYKTQIKGKIRFRVRCGSFNTRIEAEDFKKKLYRDVNVSGFVTRIEK